ncbi:MAG: thiamine-phosphate kinase [Nitrospirae bacterium]|nr:thiamine-phosphate kinase [Nitrospirota bacterium]
MKLSRLGEFGTIARIAARSRGPGEEVTVGIGDDAAAYMPGPGMSSLVAADMMVEGVHFDLGWTGYRELGRKALAVNLSDIAAMGGRPLYYLVSLGLPADMDSAGLDELYRGMEESAAPHGVRLIGGDTCSSAILVISVTIIGEAVPGKMITRTGACPGDDIYVTGTLGDSAGGLEILKAGARGEGLGASELPGVNVGAGLRARPSENIGAGMAYLINRHIDPSPRVEAGMLLARSGLVTAMIDVSDGLSSDLGHILGIGKMERASGGKLGAVIYDKVIPLSGELVGVYGRGKAVRLALHGGEDYELLFTARPGGGDALAGLQDMAGIAINKIGSVADGGGLLLETAGGKRRALRPRGYEHFAR